jgi:hypothetical protein
MLAPVHVGSVASSPRSKATARSTYRIQQTSVIKIVKGAQFLIEGI